MDGSRSHGLESESRNWLPSSCFAVAYSGREYPARDGLNCLLVQLRPVGLIDYDAVGATISSERAVQEASVVSALKLREGGCGTDWAKGRRT